MRAMAIVVALSVFSTSLGATPDYLPLQEGNQWTFTMSNGVQMTTKVTGFAEVGAVRCAIVETTMGLQKSQEYITVDTEGLRPTWPGPGPGVPLRPAHPAVKLPYRKATRGRPS